MANVGNPPFRPGSSPQGAQQVAQLAKRQKAQTSQTSITLPPSVPSSPPGGATGAAGGDLSGSYPNPSLANVTASATVGDATNSVTLTIDAAGRVRSAAAVPIAFPPFPSFADSETPTGTVNGTNTAFTLAHAPTTGSAHVYEGVSALTLQRLAPSQYSITGATLTFTTAPAVGSVLLVDYRY